MNKSIWNSVYLHSTLSRLRHEYPKDEYTIIANAKDREIKFKGSNIIAFPELQNDFEEILDHRSIDSMLDFLSLIKEQPITIQFINNSIKIHEARL